MDDATRAPHRRCVLTGCTAPVETLVRLVMGPDGSLVPDIAAKLPGRGAWVCADGPLIAAGVRDGKLAKAVSRSFKTAVRADRVPVDLRDRIEELLERRLLDRLGLIKRSGDLVTGFDKIVAHVGASERKPSLGRPRLWLTAADGSDDGRRKLSAALKGLAPVTFFDRAALSAALGRDNVVHVLLLAGGGTQRFIADLARWNGIRRKTPPAADQGPDGAGM